VTAQPSLRPTSRCTQCCGLFIFAERQHWVDRQTDRPTDRQATPGTDIVLDQPRTVGTVDCVGADSDRFGGGYEEIWYRGREPKCAGRVRCHFIIADSKNIYYSVLFALTTDAKRRRMFAVSHQIQRYFTRLDIPTRFKVSWGGPLPPLAKTL